MSGVKQKETIYIFYFSCLVSFSSLVSQRKRTQNRKRKILETFHRSIVQWIPLENAIETEKKAFQNISNRKMFLPKINIQSSYQQQIFSF